MLTLTKTHAKKFDPRKNIFDSHNPRKNLTHETHTPTDPRNQRTQVTHVTLPRNPHDWADSQIDNTKYIGVVMPMYKIIEYSDNNSKTSGSLW